MTLSECYEQFGGDLEEVKHRLPREKMIEKFMLRFPNDDSMDLLKSSVEHNNMEEAFRAAHTLKGVCMNMGFADLIVSSSALTESLRAGNCPQNELDQVISDYETVISAIGEYQQTLEH